MLGFLFGFMFSLFWFCQNRRENGKREKKRPKSTHTHPQLETNDNRKTQQRKNEAGTPFFLSSSFLYCSLSAFSLFFVTAFQTRDAQKENKPSKPHAHKQYTHTNTKNTINRGVQKNGKNGVSQKTGKREYSLVSFFSCVLEFLLCVGVCVDSSSSLIWSPKAWFQAVRFSVSGRECPSSPERVEACRVCQPMHVLSFVGGRICDFF